MTRSEILALNPNITDPRIIGLGQGITIREAAEGDTTGVNLEAEVTDDAEATSEADPDTTPEDSGESDATPDSTAETATENDEGESEGEAVASAPTEAPVEPTISPATLTPAPVVSAEDVLAASDLSAASATVCVLLFEDTNQNRIQEPNENLLSGGTIQITRLSDAQVAGSVETDGVSEPHCFDELASGGYVVAASAPADYGLTSPNQLRLQALGGTRLDVAFGAAEGVVPAVPPPADSGGIVDEVTVENAASASPFQDVLAVSGLVIFGLAAVVLVAGLGLTLFLRKR
jgi:hypothetical protein